MTLIPPGGPSQSPTGLPPPPSRFKLLAALGRRLNKRLAIILIIALCLVAASFAYTLHLRSVAEALRREAAKARPQSADPGSVLKNAPNGDIQPIVARMPNLTPAAQSPTPRPQPAPRPVAPPETMADKERKQAWLDYYAQLAALRKQRYQTAMSAIKSTDSTVFGGRLDAASTTTSAPPAARPMNAPIIPGQPFVPGYGGGFPGGFGEFGPGEEGAGQREKIAFVNQTGNLGQNDVLRQPRRQPPSPFALMAGSYIPSLAETAVNSDAPGAFIGRVTQDVHDTAHGACVIIPQGSKIIGRYDSQTTMGQERLPGVLTRIIYPDATSLDLGAMEAADQGGAAGFDAEVDRHFLQRLGNGLVIGIAGAASQLVNALPFGSAVYSGPHAAINTAAQLGLSIPPTLTVLPGTRFNVITGKDITIRPWSCNGQPPRPLLPIMTAN